jgi:hypothetical protein
MAALAVEVERVGDGGLPFVSDGGMLAGPAYHASFGLFERQ